MQPTTENTSEKRMQNEISEDLDGSKVQYNTVRFQPIPGLGDVDKNEDRQPQVQKPQPATNTIGHLINVTGILKAKVCHSNHTYLMVFLEGDIPTKVMHGLIVPATNLGKYFKIYIVNCDTK